ncbi:type IV pilus biogenesis/stability protein PilW [Acinetobacter sp. A3.8]|uniref:Type IV pilus biogenesis/stability protein PilW n=2 Tax=Acinetobacter sedimenti TaxID=2919922 RepID=A0A9X2B5Q5_9GAMM|nr:type IV pilus biogenesis/stability protein PilW [Acinetobacter sedimenti]
MSGCVTTTPATRLGEKDPEKAVQLRTQLAAEYIRTGELDKAKQELDQALNTDSRSVEANLMMGVLLQQEGSPTNMAKAEEYFKRAISIDGTHAQSRNNYGTYLYLRDRYPEAIAQFKVAGATLGYTQRYAALENLGRTYLKVGDNANAEQAFTQALQANRDSLIARLELAELLYFQQRFTLAGQMYEDYIRYTGQTNQGARALWIGLRLARARHDDLGMQVLANQLRAQFPDSQEYKRYLELKQSSEAVWK